MQFHACTGLLWWLRARHDLELLIIEMYATIIRQVIVASGQVWMKIAGNFG